MKKYAVFIQTCRHDLLDTQIKTFYYKSEMVDTDVYIVIDTDSIEFEGLDNYIDIVNNNDNPNFKAERIFTVQSIDKDIDRILDLTDYQSDTLRRYRIRGTQTPFFYLLDKGYKSVLMLEDDMLVVGPIEEFAKSGKDIYQSAWSTKTFPRFDLKSETKFYGGQPSELYEAMGFDKKRWEKIKHEYANYVSRPPYQFTPRTLKHLGPVFKKYLASPYVNDMWKNMDSPKSRNGLSYTMFHHNSLIPQIAFVDVYNENSKDVLIFDKLQTVVQKKQLDLSDDKFEKYVKTTLKYYIIHVGAGKIKKELFDRFHSVLNKLGYKGDLTPLNINNYLLAKDRSWKTDNKLLINKAHILGHINDSELDNYNSGHWLNPNASLEKLLLTKKGRDKLKQTNNTIYIDD